MQGKDVSSIFEWTPHGESSPLPAYTKKSGAGIFFTEHRFVAGPQRVQAPSKEVLRPLFTPKSHPQEVPKKPCEGQLGGLEVWSLRLWLEAGRGPGALPLKQLVERCIDFPLNPSKTSRPVVPNAS